VFEWRSASEWRRLWRYYQAGIVNTAFGYGLFALFVRFGLNIYVAQIVSHVLGASFNYFTYSRYAFVAHRPSKLKFALSYAGNYVMGLAALALIARLAASPYLAGFLATVLVSLVNYFVLKRLVFSKASA